MTASDASAVLSGDTAKAARKAAGEAFTAAWAGQPLSASMGKLRPEKV